MSPMIRARKSAGQMRFDLPDWQPESSSSHDWRCVDVFVERVERLDRRPRLIELHQLIRDGYIGHSVLRQALSSEGRDGGRLIDRLIDPGSIVVQYSRKY